MIRKWRHLSIRLVGAGALAAGALTFGLVGPVEQAAAAQPLTITLTSNSAPQVSSSSGNCTYSLNDTVAITNNTSVDETVPAQETTFGVTYSEGSTTGNTSDVTVENGAGFRTNGASVAANSTNTYSPLEVSFTVPCDATDVVFTLSMQDSNGVTSSGSQQVVGGGGSTGTPEGGVVGLAGLLVVAGGALVLIGRRQRGRKIEPELEAESTPTPV